MTACVTHQEDHLICSQLELDTLNIGRDSHGSGVKINISKYDGDGYWIAFSIIVSFMYLV
jgi:hypothetical protein